MAGVGRGQSWYRYADSPIVVCVCVCVCVCKQVRVVGVVTDA